jgi:hypothetical protein
MDCRKARYYLVVSFDETLSADVARELSGHLKDCGACRHESFYYRELFSAEKQVSVRQPKADFNERLVAEIRLREAQSAWPEATPAPARRSFRWPLVYVPALFGAAAIASFLMFLPETPAPVPVAAAPAVSPAPPVVTTVAERPRYVPVLRARRSPASTVIFEWPPAVGSSGNSGDPFRNVLASGGSNLRNVRPRSLEQYVLPVVTQTVERDRIY